MIGGPPAPPTPTPPQPAPGPPPPPSSQPTAAATQPAVSVPDPQLALAVDLGWHMAWLHRHASFDQEQLEDRGGGLPDVRSLSPLKRTELALGQVKAALHLLAPRLVAAAVSPVAVPELPKASGLGSGQPEAFRSEIAATHLEVMLALGAADFRLGQAYSLGQGLADTALLAEDRESFDDAFGAHLVAVKDWLADLTSSLSPHAGRSVTLTLRAWERWAAAPTIDAQPLDWDQQGAGVRAALGRQGDLWRALLADEKRGQDMLKAASYLSAARSLLWRYRWLLALLFGLALLLGAGIAVVTSQSGAEQAIGAAVTAAGALGITGAGIRARASSVATQLESHLWGAELDFAIAEAVLIGPRGWGVKLSRLEVPAAGSEPKVAANLETLRQFRQAVAKGRKRTIEGFLATDAQFIADGETHTGPTQIAEWITSAAERERIASEPEHLLAGRPGYIVAFMASGADVWRLREGKISRWQSFPDRGSARVEAGLPAV